MRHIEHDAVVEIILKYYFCQSCGGATVPSSPHWAEDVACLQSQLQLPSRRWPAVTAHPEPCLPWQMQRWGSSLERWFFASSQQQLAEANSLVLHPSQGCLPLRPSSPGWLATGRCSSRFGKAWLYLLGCEAIVRSPQCTALTVGAGATGSLLVPGQTSRRHPQWVPRGRGVTVEASMCGSGLIGQVYSDCFPHAALDTQGTALRCLLLLSACRYGVAKCFSVLQMPLLCFSRKLF